MSRACIARWVIGIAGVVLIGLACAGVVALASYETGTELPLRKVSGVAVNARGQIFCALARASVVQVYGEQGTFLHSFKIPGNPSWFQIRIGDQGELEVATIRGRMLHVFSADGELLESTPASESGGRYEKFAFQVNRSAVDAHGAILKVQNGELIRYTPDGRIEVLVRKRGFDLYRLGTLAPLLFSAGMGLIVIGLLGIERTMKVVRSLASIRYLRGGSR